MKNPQTLVEDLARKYQRSMLLATHIFDPTDGIDLNNVVSNWGSPDLSLYALIPRGFNVLKLAAVKWKPPFYQVPQGLKLFTQSWTPLQPTKITGLICVIHGYTNESSWFIQLTSIHLAKAGFVVCVIDHQGHSFSEGLQHHIPDISLWRRW
ncbi:hypothetical protein L1987_40830 [Smallanthus sonchifolius]|uniref:Uncharacterized protein n=1 Tax=Smallanthus sonchifolius TaxID=185202 RepID=A0ACB9GTP7_9ASTR|nr:hypothetical protein L1987_40830 [Smallanthus sonchifolius]